MKILHLFKTYLPDSFGGVERVIWEIAEGLTGSGIESHVLSLSVTGGGPSVRVGNHISHQAKCDLYFASVGLSLSAFKAFRGLAADADIIHYHFPWPMMDLLHLVERPPCPTVVTYHSDVVRQRFLNHLYRPLMHRFLSRVDSIVATSPNYAESSPVLRHYANRAKTTIIPIGISDRPKPPPDATLARWRSRVGEDFFLFIGVGRYYKGLCFLLEAARLTDLPVVVVGAGGAIDLLLRETNTGNVQAVGSVSDVDKEALLTLCRAFVFPSHLRSEAFGVALLEAARSGRPMISCEIGTGTTYVNVNNVTGLSILPADVHALSAAMQRLANDPEMAEQMGRNARKRYMDLFRAEKMCARYHALYQGLLGH